MRAPNKHIRRDEGTTRIFDERSLEHDYRTLIPVLKPGLKVLDVGCGTGAISKDVAQKIGQGGSVVGIDNTEHFIKSGRELYQHVSNLDLLHCDLFDFDPDERFDLIISARTLQWLSNPREALLKMKTLLKPGGMVSILDYNHEDIEWTPSPPQSMLSFYQSFLRWRRDAGMDNAIAENLVHHFIALNFKNIEVHEANERYRKDNENFVTRAGIWSKVAGLKQIAEEGYIAEEDRRKTIDEYGAWVTSSAQSMTMKLKEVRGNI